MSPTTREVEAGRVERRRKAAEAPPPPARPSSAQGRRTARVEAAHAKATAPASYTCRVEDCPDAGTWHPAATRDAALRASRRHYLERHYAAP